MPTLTSYLLAAPNLDNGEELTPGQALDAARRAAMAGDIEAVREWLANADDVNALDVGMYAPSSTVLAHCPITGADIDYEDVDYESKTCRLASLKVEIARLLLASGADPNLGTVSEYPYANSTPLLNTMLGCYRLLEGAVDPVAHILDMAVLLLDAGARVNTRNDANEYSGIYETPLGCALSSLGPESPHSIKFVAILLQAGASLDDCGGNVYTEEVYSAEWQVSQREQSRPDRLNPEEPWHECEGGW